MLGREHKKIAGHGRVVYTSQSRRHVQVQIWNYMSRLSSDPVIMIEIFKSKPFRLPSFLFSIYTI